LILLDTTVLSYAVGQEHPFRDPSRRIVEAAASGTDRVTTTVEVIQEFAHVQSRRRQRAGAVSLARSYVDLLSPLIEIGAEDLELGFRLFERHAALGAFDAVLAAAAIRLEVEALVSGDSAFASVPKLAFVALDSAELDGLLD
jgi:predicted nucleic acid-binding protein